MFVFLNDKFIQEAEATIPITNRGFLYGDAVFETMRVNNYKILHMSRHIQRLQKACNIFGFSKINIDFQTVISRLLELNKQANCLVKIHVSRTSSESGYLPKNESDLSILITSKELYPNKNQLNLCIARDINICSQNPNQSTKTANSLPYILAAMYARYRKFDDAIILNEKNEITETSKANIFWIKQNILYTPSLSSGCINGIIRQVIINNFQVLEGDYRIDNVLDADMVFITNSSIIVKEICKIEEKQYSTKMHSFLEDIKAKALT